MVIILENRAHGTLTTTVTADGHNVVASRGAMTTTDSLPTGCFQVRKTSAFQILHLENIPSTEFNCTIVLHRTVGLYGGNDNADNSDGAAVLS